MHKFYFLNSLTIIEKFLQLKKMKKSIILKFNKFYIILKLINLINISIT